jgi:hypothetical protein
LEIQMAPQNTRTNTRTQAKRTGSNAKRTARSARRTTRSAARSAAAEKNQIVKVAETAVDVPVGVALSFTDRVQELVEPWTDRVGAERQLSVYRTQLTRNLKRAERRGSTARRKATTQAKRTRTRVEREVRRVEREARRRQRRAETTLRQNRRRVETTLRRNRRQAEQQLRKATRRAGRAQSDVAKAVEDQSSRAQEFVGQVSDQIATLR